MADVIVIGSFVTDMVARVERFPKEGETVLVAGTTKMAFQSIFLAFILPSLLILATLIAANAKLMEDGIAALSAIGILGGYYFMLYFFRDRLKRTLKFTLLKL